ncbi:hypothetical protein GMST_12970 [Geomonas silvestris]|uniref:Uncharacterized protein n=1 Tax=Geomonas silvestris TaxID=2740184 RepID=A0A6V8MGA1_9BACT|nr:hypothetical protein [Geomonas silvestris]GFO58972.1 hypothetical protein GMST_12970 [Geomonas silvestris]
MLDNLNNIGDDVYRTWSEEQRRDEIGKLVEGYRNGIPAQILCRLAVSIAGSRKLAAGHLAAFLSSKERKAIVKKESAGADSDLRDLLKGTLLFSGSR